MDKASVCGAIRDITIWLQSKVRLLDGAQTIDKAIVDQLRQAGLPLTRFTTGVPSLHPQVDSFSALWERGKGLTFRQYRDVEIDGNVRSQSPIFMAYDEGRSQRFRLEGRPPEGEYELLSEFRATGLTEYFVLALPFADGSHKAMSFATDRTGGFDDGHIEILYGLQHPLAAIVELGYLRHLAVTLMETYVGPMAGRRVLAGDIRRGSGETFRAVIWFCDLKGFTALSEQLPSQVLIDTLNAYFDATTSAIESHGGEILKFIGDAVLAIFLPKDGNEAAAAGSAISAATDATRQIDAANALRTEAGEPQIDCGIALHIGEVTYGNVGGQNRLDFTVIGPAVNLASRIEALTRQLRRSVLVSSDIAALLGGDFEELGTFELKGVRDRQKVFSPRLG